MHQCKYFGGFACHRLIVLNINVILLTGRDGRRYKNTFPYQKWRTNHSVDGINGTNLLTSNSISLKLFCIAYSIALV